MEPAFVMKTAAGWLKLTDPVEVREVEAPSPDALEGLGGGLWAGYVTYEQGRAWEPYPATVEGCSPSVWLARFETVERTVGCPIPEGEFSSTDLSSDTDRDTWRDNVGHIKKHLHDGDCYQVNLTRRLTGGFNGSIDGFARRLWEVNPAPMFAHVRTPEIEVVSASPETFLHISPDRISTSPIKGTAAEAGELRRSAKDKAENVMIVDLCRNDLGRIARPGTVKVDALCRLESHPGLHHLVSDVSCRPREGLELSDVFAATFPAASITGAPKPRVMQIIDQLERTPRGVYCGAVGWWDADEGTGSFSVAIRTFTIRDGEITLGVGGGITEGSDAGAEWEETELKAARISSALR